MVTGDGVSSPDQLRSYAVDCARLAQGATAPEEKARLLNIAQAWTSLAGRIERLGRVAKEEPGSEPATDPADSEAPKPKPDEGPG
jgi:hypothetical protein